MSNLELNKHVASAILSIVALSSLVAFSLTDPLDDYSRHLIIHQLNFDYKSLYGATAYPFDYSFWFTYEWLLAEIANRVGIENTTFLVGILFFTVFIYPFFIKHSMGDGKLILFLGIYILISAEYFQNLRPASLLSMLVINSFLIHYNQNLSSRVKTLHLVFVASISVTLYHGFFGFLLLVALLNPVLIGGAILIGGAGWFYATNGQWLEFEQLLMSIDREGAIVSELRLPFFLALIAILSILYLYQPVKKQLNLYWAFDHAPLIFAVLILISTLQARFLLLAITLLFLLAIVSLDSQKERINQWLVYLISALATHYLLGNISHYDLERVDTPLESKRVITDNMGTMFDLVKRVNKPMHLEPSMEIAFSKNYLRNFFNERDGEKRCEYLIENQFDYFIETGSHQENMKCLTLTEAKGDLILWKVESRPHNLP